ncbi:DUF5615 family PIN-like protein [Rhodococcus sp. NPDC058481]|uniref:DUF5615 family PIN-like protein n=1 Tax=unclassified Rhodococcus (in: high G+C Gram-positive bacteria) TaxID=192944 RepID=UPI003666BF90
MAIGCATAVGAGLLLASPVAASPLLAGPAIVHQQAQNVEIEKKYVEWGGAGSPLGSPVGEVYVVGNGFGQNYEGGVIFYSPDSGAKVMYGVILDKYRELGGPAGDVGFPSTDEADATGGANRVSEFRTPGGAKIFWTPEAGAWLVRGPILAAWDKLGGAAGPIGYPIAAEAEVDGVHVAKFSGNGGTAEIRWSEADGFVTVPPELAADLEGLAIPGVPSVSVPTVDASVPSVDVDVPGVDIDVDGSEESTDDGGGINKWWAVPVGLAIAAGAGGLLGLLGRRRKGDVDVAGVKGPKIDGPDLKAPKIDGPDLKAPTLKTPDVDLPDVKAPDVKVPKHSAPDLDLPDADLPDVKAPKLSGGAVAGAAGAVGAAGLGAAALGGKLTGSGRDVDADLPKADVDLPDAGVDLPKADVDVNAPKLGGGLDVDAPNVGLSGAGKVAGGLTAAGLGAGALTWLTSKKGGSDANLEAVYAGLGGTDDIDVSYEEVVTGIPTAAVGGVKFLVDENLSPKVAGLLRDAGYDAVHVFDADLRGGNNDQVLARATADGRTLITAELSYVDDLIASQSGPSVLLLRRGGATIDEQASVLLASIPKVAPAIGSGALASLGVERIRVRSLPLRRS